MTTSLEMKVSPQNFENIIITGTNGKSYKLGELIFRGPIYRCVELKDPSHPDMNPEFSCKVILKKTLDKKGIESLIREVEILRKIHHENVLGLHDLLETEGFVFLIMPFMEGGSLLDKIVQRKKFSEADARRVITQIANGLAYLHSHGICHRDIKPENIFCSGEEENFRVVITNFRLSKDFSHGELMTEDCGTPQYAAPEVYKHQGSYSEACDIWSLGVLTYGLETGFFPFDYTDLKRLPYAVCNGRYNKSRLTKLSQPAQEFITRLLRVDPKERPTASDLVKSDKWLSVS